MRNSTHLESKDIRQADQTETKRAWLAMQYNLSTLSEQAQKIIWYAAIPHWFDIKLLSGLMEEDIREESPEFTQLLQQPYVEVSQEGQGWKIHEHARSVLLERLWNDNPDRYRTLSHRAAIYCEQQEDNNNWKRERIYHALISMPTRGTEMLNELVWKLQAPPYFAYDMAEQVVRAASEHANAGRLGKQASAWTSYWEGYLSYYYARYDQARDTLLQINVTKEEDQELVASRLKTLGDVYTGLEDFEQARKYYKEALPLFVDKDDFLIRIDCISSLGDVYLKLVRYDMAREQYSKALELYQQSGNRQGAAYTLWSLGNISMLVGDDNEARKWHNDALAIYRQINDHFGEAYCLDSLGTVYINLGEYDLSSKQYNEAAIVYHLIGKYREEAYCLMAVGDVQMNTANYSRASKLYKKALLIFQEIGDRKGEADCMVSFGDLNIVLKKLNNAQKYYNKAILIYREINDHASEVKCIESLEYLLGIEK